MKESTMTSMSIGATLLMLWAVMEFLEVPLNVSLLLLGGTHLLVGFLFYIMVALKEKEDAQYNKG